jgi:peptidoglycan/xylan/chitin deacetylase (PgdA/CDA1 family)
MLEKELRVWVNSVPTWMSRGLVITVSGLLLAASPSGAGTGSPLVAGVAALGRPLVCGGPHGRAVALTFDDGPGPASAGLVRILQRAHARATFFLVGRQVAQWPYLAARERQVGALGDHTWSHARLTRMGVEGISRQLVWTKHAIERATRTPVQLFRPPYGAHDRAVDETARTLGLLEVLWSVDSRDSEGAPASRVASNVERGLRPGSIVLLHENHPETVRALRDEILPYLRAHRLNAVGIPELLRVDPPGRKLLAAGLAGCLRLPGVGR